MTTRNPHDGIHETCMKNTKTQIIMCIMQHKESKKYFGRCILRNPESSEDDKIFDSPDFYDSEEAAQHDCNRFFSATAERLRKNKIMMTVGDPDDVVL